MRGTGLTVLLLVVATAACAPPAGPSTEITALSEQWVQAFNAPDVDALVAMYTDDARVLPPNAAVGQGPEAIAASFGEMIDSGVKAGLETVEAIAGGDLGYHVGTYVIKTPQGEVIDRGKFIETWRKVDGTWKISNDIWNSDTPAGGAGPAASLVITHEVKDGARWLAAWQGEDSRHGLFAKHGAPKVRVFQRADNPQQTGLMIDVADMSAFQAFMNSPEATKAKDEDGVKETTLRVYAEIK